MLEGLLQAVVLHVARNEVRSGLGTSVAFIERHFAEDITSADIARAGGVSEREMQREFRATIGERPGSYLMSHRLFVASQLLKSTDASAGEVTRRCGFASQSYFSKRFRERYGHAPREHRAIG